MKINQTYLDYAKSGLFMAFGAVTDENGHRMKIEVTDEHLTSAAEIALEYLTSVVFGPEARVKIERKDAA